MSAPAGSPRLPRWPLPSLLLASLAPLGGGLLLEGWVPQQAVFHEFIGKFVIQDDPSGGQVALVDTRIHPLGATTIKKGQLHVVVYDDEGSHWKSMKNRWDKTSCEEKKQAASWVQNISMSSGDWSENFHVVQRHRPRFWYFTLIGCDVNLNVPLRYSIHVTNTLLGWQEEVSFDHKDQITMNAFAALAFSGTTLVMLYATRVDASLKDFSKEHPYVQLLLCAQVASTASACLAVMHDFFFLRSGLGSQRLGFLGAMAATVANSTVFLVAILASTGWAITTPALPHRRTFLGMVAAVGGLSALCELHAGTAVTQSSDIYAYQSGPGQLNMVLKIFAFCWFSYQLKITHGEESDSKRRQFYRALATCTALLALHIPASVIVSYYVSPWVRFRVVTAVDIGARWSGQSALTLLFLGGLTPISMANSLVGMGGKGVPNTAHGDFGGAATEFRSLADDGGDRPSLSI